MSDNTDFVYETKRKMLAKYPRFGSEVAASPIVFTKDVRTASTDGKNIYLNPEYFANANEDVRLYLLAHETAHKKFKHMYRLKDKDGNMRDMDLWNIVCDALVNANLKRDGIKIPDGRICSETDKEYGDWVLQYNSEELYEMKKREKEEQENKQNQEQENGNNNEKQEKEDNNNSEQNSDEDKGQGDDHSIWKEAFEQQQKDNSKKRQTRSENVGKSSKQQNEQEQSQGQIQEQQTNQEENEQQWSDIDEREEFEQNREEKRKKFKSRKGKTEENIRNTDKKNIELGEIGQSKEEIDWKLLVRKEIEKDETIWSQRRSIAENNYAYRLEENEIEDEAETEVMIDVSGSVNLELVKAFLRQLKPLLKESKLRVGCFNEKFWGFVDIKNTRDIDNFVIPEEARGASAWTEDWDLAVRSFTKKREINKMVFTDGYPCPGNMPKEDLKKENIIWLVYGNKEFKPCCGKIINITEKQLERLNKADKTAEDYITR